MLRRVLNVIAGICIAIDIFLVGKILLSDKNIAVLNPQGIIASQDKSLMILAILLMLVVVIPVFALAFFVAIRYNVNNTKAHYAPQWHSTKLQIFFWAFLCLDILVLSTINWVNAHKLDPHNPLIANQKPITIQVVALQWKWLFIYPEQHIATVNYVVFPQKSPIHFELTALDTPMNSFWIPQLGGQIYAMSGMATQTHLMASSVGEYRGSNAEISGAGFASMTFTAKSVSSFDFTAWVAAVKSVSKPLSFTTLKDLAKPGEVSSPLYYSSTEDNLYTTIVTNYMAHTKSTEGEKQAQKPSYNVAGMKM